LGAEQSSRQTQQISSSNGFWSLASTPSSSLLNHREIVASTLSLDIYPITFLIPIWTNHHRAHSHRSDILHRLTGDEAGDAVGAGYG